MSPKALALSVFFVGAVVGIGPHLPEMISSSGVTVPHWLKFLGSLLMAVCAYTLLQLPSLKELANSSGKNGDGGVGKKLDGTPSVPPPPKPPMAAFAGIALLLAACHNPNAGQIVTNDLSPAAQCVMAAVLSGRVTLADPKTAALQLLAQCVGLTAEGLVKMFEQLLGSDAGIGAPGDSIVAELRKLPPGFNHDDAVKALAAKR